MKKEKVLFELILLFAFAFVIFNSGLVSSACDCTLTQDFSCPSGCNCDTCPAGCPCSGYYEICVEGACVTPQQSQTTCPYYSFSASNCDNKCPSGYSCTEIISAECSKRNCNLDVCWCEKCSIEHTHIYVCASSYETSYTCGFSFKADTDCDTDIDWEQYPLRKQDIISVSPSSRDFGTVETGSCSSTKNFVVTNPSSGPSMNLVGSASVSAPFTCDSGCSYNLAPGQSQTVKIKFCPTRTRIYSRTLSFSGGDGAFATVTGKGGSPTIYYALTVSKTGTGSGTVTGSGINCGTTCSREYESGTSVTLTASAATNSTFAGWSGACSGTGSCTVTMNSDRIVRARFNPASVDGKYLLTVNKNGLGYGTVTSSPTGINCGSDCSESYDSGTSVTLTASAATNSTFEAWGRACAGTGNESPCVLTMNSDQTATARFVLKESPPGPEPELCDLTSASWSSTEVIEGTTVGMDTGGSNCASVALSFNIYRSSTHIKTIYGVFPSSSWTAEPESSTPYYFIAKVVDNPSESAISNNLLVKKTGGPPPGYCDEIVLCSHYEIEGDCNSNICDINVQDSVPNVDCSNPNIDCNCIWKDGECKGSWSGGPGGYCGDGVVNAGETCDGSDWGPVTGCDNFDEFTGGTLSCGSNCQFDTSSCTGGTTGICGDGEVNIGEQCDGSDWGPVTGCGNFDDFTGGTLSCGSNCQFDTSSCTGGPGGYCGDDNVNAGETCDGSDWGPVTGCGNFDDFTGGTLSCGSNCQFDTSSCTGGTTGVCGDGEVNIGETCDGSDWGPITGCSNFDNFTGGTLSCGADCLFDTISCTGGDVETGTCIYTQYSDDDCEDGFLTFSWTVEWIWDAGCDSACQKENQNITLQCVNGQKTVECPAQIPLPFFNIYSFIATLVIIMLVYVVIISKKKK